MRRQRRPDLAAAAGGSRRSGGGAGSKATAPSAQSACCLFPILDRACSVGPGLHGATRVFASSGGRARSPTAAVRPSGRLAGRDYAGEQARRCGRSSFTAAACTAPFSVAMATASGVCFSPRCRLCLLLQLRRCV